MWIECTGLQTWGIGCVAVERAGAIASAAVRLVVEFALTELRLNRVEIIVPSENVPSVRVAENVGAKLEGLLKQRIVLGRRSQDALSYSFTLFPQEGPVEQLQETMHAIR